jgi:hypothetical protein
MSTARHARIIRSSQKTVSLKVVHPLKIYQNTKFNGPTLSSASFAFTSELLTSATLELLQLQH